MRRESCFLIPVVSVEINPLFSVPFFIFFLKLPKASKVQKVLIFVLFSMFLNLCMKKHFLVVFFCFLVVLLVVKFFQMYVNGT